MLGARKRAVVVVRRPFPALNIASDFVHTATGATANVASVAEARKLHDGRMAEKRKRSDSGQTDTRTHFRQVRECGREDFPADFNVAARHRAENRGGKQTIPR